MEKRAKLIAVSGLVLTFLAGCSSTPTAEQPAAPVESRASVAPPPVPASEPNTGGLPRVLTDPSSILSKRSVFFDLDSYVIKDQHRELVGAHANFLKQNTQFKILVQGNADERGSREYNLSLGQKRADALKKALALLGVSEGQIESVSLGKEKPRNEGHDEAAWAENRRDDILYNGEY